MWEDKWVQGGRSALIPRTPEAKELISTVADCIDNSGSTWKHDVVSTCFSDDDCKSILQTPLSIFPGNDNRYWEHTKDGVYTVKSGYWFGLLGDRVLPQNLNEVWRIIWNLGGPPKLSHFVWQACKGNMAVKEVLYKRHIAQDELCQCCGVEVESINHVLFECVGIGPVWDNSKHGAIVRAAPAVSLESKLLWWVDKVSMAEVREIVTIAWAVWFCRNKLIDANEDLNPQVMATKFLRMVEEYRSYSHNVFSPISNSSGPGSLVSSWTRPPADVIKINVDAHIVEGRYVSLGAVFRDNSGSVLMMATKHIVGCERSTMAEAEAARYGLQIARRMGFDKVWLESDALAVVGALHHHAGGLSPLYLLFYDIRVLSLSFMSFRFSHIRRVGNTVAHLVARWDSHGSAELICMAPIPQSISTLAEYDLQ